jgi:repressor LexA
MQKALTPNQQRVLLVIKQYLTDLGASPTLRDIKEKLGINSTNTVVKHLIALENKGYIVRHKHAKRNIELRNGDPSKVKTFLISVPVMASVGCDDLSVVADEKYDEFLEVDNNIIGNRNRADIFAVRAIGDSMNDAGIESGDYVLIEKTEICQNGDRVVAVVGDMVTVKKFEKRSDVIVLRPESKDPKYRPIILHEDFKIAGKVICTIPGGSMDPTEVVYEKINN